MYMNEPSPQEFKQIIFKVDADYHEQIKCIAAKKRMSMRDWIINAITVAIDKDK